MSECTEISFFCSATSFAFSGVESMSTRAMKNEDWIEVTDCLPRIDFTCHLIPWIRQVGQSICGTKIRPCLTRIFIVRSPINLSPKLSSLSCRLVALSFWAATRIYLTGTDESGTNLSHMSSTYASNLRASPEWNSLLLPLCWKTHLLSGTVHLSLEFSGVYRTGRPGFGGSLRGFSLIHEILLGPRDAIKFINHMTRMENRKETHLVCSIDVRKHCFCYRIASSQITVMVCFSRMIYHADGLSNFNTHFHTIACGAKMIQNGLKLVQFVHCALDLCMQSTQVTVMSLGFNLSRKSTCWNQLGIYLSNDPELQSWDCINEIHLEIGWSALNISEAIKAKINSHFVSFCDFVSSRKGIAV